MMAAIPSRTLSERQARDIVAHSVDCLRRAGVCKWFLDASHPVEGFTRVYDELIFVFVPLDSDYKAQCSGQLLREALLLLESVSRCPGYFVDENLAFWNDVLTLALIPGSLLARRRFPRVVFGLGASVVTTPHNTLNCWLTDLFSKPWPLSQAGQRLLVYTRTFCRYAQAPVECVVTVYFERTERETARWIRCIAPAATTVASASSVQHDLVWSAVQVTPRKDSEYLYHGLSTPCREMIAGLCEALPPTMTVEVQFPWTHQMPPRSLSVSPWRKFAPFLSRVIGQVGTEWLGRMVELNLTTSTTDVTYLASVKPDFACLCTLLPFSRSLQKLSVAVETPSDLLWLMYAVLHPQTKYTSWRSLHLDGQDEFGRILGWESVGRFARSQYPLASLFSHITGHDIDKLVQMKIDAGNGFLWRTAIITGAADVRFPEDAKKALAVTTGDRVEVCETALAAHNDSGASAVAVIIPGVGCGWVQSRHVTQIIDTQYEGNFAHAASVTTLTLGILAILPTEMAVALPLFWPRLRHLSAIHQAWYSCSEIAAACPLLESLSMCVKGSQSPTLGVGAMSSLRSVELFCDDPFLGKCFQFLMGLRSVHTIRIHARTTAGRYDGPGDVFRRLERNLLITKRTVRSLTVAFYARNIHSAADEFALDDMDVDPLMVRRKLAFLSVALASPRTPPLSPSAINVVLEYLGPSLSVGNVVFVYEGDFEETSQQWPENWVERGVGYQNDRVRDNEN